MGIGIMNQDWELVFRIRIGIRIGNLDLGLGFGNRFGDWDWALEL